MVGELQLAGERLRATVPSAPDKNLAGYRVLSSHACGAPGRGHAKDGDALNLSIQVFHAFPRANGTLSKLL